MTVSQSYVSTGSQPWQKPNKTVDSNRPRGRFGKTKELNMALKTCQECGGSVAGSASRCPHCGKERTTLGRLIIGTIAGLILCWVTLEALV